MKNDMVFPGRDEIVSGGGIYAFIQVIVSGGGRDGVLVLDMWSWIRTPLFFVQFVHLEDVGEQGWVGTTNAGKRDRAEGVTVHLVEETHHKGLLRCII